jgi:hypothetical protein
MFLMTTRMVLVQNMTKATVTLVVNNSNFKRALQGENAKVNIPFDVLFNGMSEPGIDVMFKKGYLYIPNKQDRIDLGLEFAEEEEVNDEEVKTALSSVEMLAILKENNPVVIKTTFENLAEIQRMKFANVAAENGIYTPGLAKFVKDYTGIDLLKAMKDIQDDKEDKM